jgi:hypothetical protein
MSKLEAIEKRISGLSAEELAKFRNWFVEFDAAAWDRQIEQDVKPGNSTRWAMKRFASTRPANPPSFEALCLSEVLGLLPRTAAGRATFGGREVSASQR